MKQSIASLQAPALAGVVRERTTKGAIAQIQNCLYAGANMIDLHLPLLEESSVEELKKIVDASKLPILALNYKKTSPEGDFSEEDRVASLLRAVEAGVAGVDFQGYTLDPPSRQGFFGKDEYSFTKNSPKEVVTDQRIIAKQCDLIGQVHERGAEVLLSCHPGIYMTAQQVVDLALFLEKRKPDVIKIVTRAEDELQMVESLKAMLLLKKEVKTPVTYHASGKAGTLSRLINPVLGGHIAFCVERFGEESNIDQVDLRTAETIIRNLEKYR